MPAHVPPVATEQQALLGYLDQQRNALRIACFGLDDAEAASSPSCSALSVGGLVRHLTQVERFWCSVVRGAPAMGSGDDYTEGFRLPASTTLDEALAEYETAACETNVLIASFDDLGEEFPVPAGVPWFPSDVATWSVRWVVLHLIEETARHAGHADVIREAIDGASAISLMAAAENWTPQPWVTPWSKTA